MTKILIVEDEISLQQGLKDNLEFEGYSVNTASEGGQGLEMILTGDYNLILLDVMLPGKSGFDICKESRKRGIQTPIILLTSKSEELDKVRGLELGADDYITKPFSLRELLARIKAILRRMNTEVEPDNQSNKGFITIGNLRVDFDKFQGFVGNKEIKFTHRELEILRYLWLNKNNIVSRDNLLTTIWGEDYEPTHRTIDNFILKIRQKIENMPSKPRILLTVHGMGYKLVI